MSFLFEQKVGKHIYIYECTSFRNENGAPRNKRVPVGKIDTKTGEKVFKDSYIARMKEEGNPLVLQDDAKQFSISDVRQSSVREYGLFHLLRTIAQRNGLIEALSKAFSGMWREIFMLAAFLVTTDDPFMLCCDWIESTEGFPVGDMSSQRISELLDAIEPEYREEFYKVWCALRSDKEYLALDITSTSSYSELIDDVEWGYNRDKEHLPQVNICLLMGEESMLPIYQTTYSGSIKDVSTLNTTLSALGAITCGRPVLVVTDKGFFSKSNVDSMFAVEGRKFIMAVPFTSSFAKKQVENERGDIDCIGNTIFNNGDSLRGVTKLCSWGKDNFVHAHVYFNAKKAALIRESLYSHVAQLKEAAEGDPKKYSDSAEHEEYLNIRKSVKASSGYTVSIKEAVVESKLRTCGWLVIISNDVSSAKEALRIYRAKDIVEKGFLRLKRNLGLGRLRVHSHDRMEGRLFVGFVALILLSELHRVMTKKKLYDSMTMRQLIRTLSKLRLHEIGGIRILAPTTKEQRRIFEAFDVEPPV